MRMDHIGRVTGLEDPSTRPWTHSGGNAVELAADLLGPPFRQPPRGRSAAATSPHGGGKSVGAYQRDRTHVPWSGGLPHQSWRLRETRHDSFPRWG